MRFDTFLVNLNREIINPLIEILFALAVVYFLYGLAKFLMNQSDEENRTNGKKHMIWGVIGIFIMMAVFGIMNMILSTLNIPKSDIDPDTGTVDLKDYNPTYPRLGPPGS